MFRSEKNPLELQTLVFTNKLSFCYKSRVTHPVCYCDNHCFILWEESKL